MLNEEICKLRDKLNDSIVNGADYNITYQISVELDQLIAEYYSAQMHITKNARLKHAKQKKNKNKELVPSK